MSTPPLPAGYALDATPPLPAGYSLDSSPNDTSSTEGQGFWAHVGKSLRSMVPEDIPSFTDVLKQAGVESLGPGYKALQALHGAATEYAAARERGHGIPYSAAAGASTAVGVSPERMEQAAETGDTAGVLGEAAVPTALAIAPEGARLAGKVGLPSAVRSVVADAKPELAARLNKTHSLTGQAAAYLADKILPDSPEGLAQKQLNADAAAMRQRNLQARVAESKAAEAAGQTVAEYRAAQKAAAKAAAKPEKSAVVTPANPVESEGRPATWTNASISDLSRRGGPLAFDAAKQAQLRQLDVPDVGLVADPRATPGGAAIGSSADRLAYLRELAAPALKGGPADFMQRMTLNTIGDSGARPIVNPADQFEASFGPEHKEVGDLAEWETGNREGVRVGSDLDNAAKSMFGGKSFVELSPEQKAHILRIAQTQVVVGQ